MSSQKTKSYSIKLRIAYAIFALVAIQGLVLLCAIAISGVLVKNDIATYNTLANQANTRKNEVQNIFTNKRMNMVNLSTELSQKIEEVLSLHEIRLNSLAANQEPYAEILDTALNDLIFFTKYNEVTGVFFVFDPTADVDSKTKTSRTSMYIRDSSPGITAENNSNLLLEYGRVDLARQKGIAVDYLWTQEMRFSTNFSRDFYFKPIDAILQNPVENAKPHVYGYWSTPFTLRSDDVPVIAYSLPLVLSNGSVCGVIGFELDINYVSNLMPAVEVPFDRGFYLLGADKGEGFYNTEVVSSGAHAKQFLAGPKEEIDYAFVYESEKAFIYEISRYGLPRDHAIGSYNEIGLYETYSPFYNEKWALTCMAPKSSVMSGSNSIKQAIGVSIAVTIIFALIVSIFIIGYIFSPIHRLFGRVRSIDPKNPVRFEKTGIREIDELSEAFEVLSDGVSEAAAKMFKIIELVDLPLGSFEISYKEDKVYVSKSLFRLINIADYQGDSSIISIQDWQNFLKTLVKESVTKTEEGITETLYAVDDEGEAKRWFRIRQITENMRDIGVLIDVTGEITHKQKVEFERDHDALTKLLNRQAFLDRSAELMRANPDTVGIMMFADIDDLKFVNDMYGHATGDNYIKTFASLLYEFSAYGAVVGRISGDEFVMFTNGFPSREAARAHFDSIFCKLKDLTIAVSDGGARYMSVSVGLSYCPDDSDDVRELVKYADFAMYGVKHTVKNGIREFDKAAYDERQATAGFKYDYTYR